MVKGTELKNGSKSKNINKMSKGVMENGRKYEGKNMVMDKSEHATLSVDSPR